jgi:hypothetical protein
MGMLSYYFYRTNPLAEPSTATELYGANNSVWLMILHFGAAFFLALERTQFLPQPWREVPMTLVTFSYIVYQCFIGINLRRFYIDVEGRTDVIPGDLTSWFYWMVVELTVPISFVMTGQIFMLLRYVIKTSFIQRQWILYYAKQTS